MKMKSYLTEWKKFKNKILNEGPATENAKQELDAAKENESATEIYAKNLIKQAKKSTQIANQELEAAKNKEAADQAAAAASEPANQGSSSPQPTTGPIGEANISGARDDGQMGKQPGDFPDVPNANGPAHLAMEEELTEEELEEASGCHEGIDEAGRSCQLELQYEEIDEERQCNKCRDCTMCGLLTEAKYKGRTVKLNKPMRGDVKKFKVFVRDPSTGNIKKVNFGDPNMRIKKSNPARRKSFRARHNCANPGPKTKARYWSCRKW
jgi:hypothetical protein